MHSAKYATTTAVWISYLIAAVNGLIAALSFVYQKPFGGISGWSLLDAALFAAAGWGLGDRSLVSTLGCCRSDLLPAKRADRDGNARVWR
jgi:hypothetical protein